LASSALIGAVRFEWEVGAVSANKVDPASATAMSGPRALMIVFMAALLDLTVFGSGNEPPRQINHSRRKLPADGKNRPPTGMIVHCPRRYWTAASFVIGWTPRLLIGRLQRLL
jgi:hypothetical protein